MDNASPGCNEADKKLEQEARKMLKPPNRRRYDEESQELTSTIRTKEADLKSCVQTCKALQGELQSVRVEKDSTVRNRKGIDKDLTHLNQEIPKKNAELAKLRSKLIYKTEHQLMERIQRLERELRQNNFNLNDERKIVAEIDSLKRTKKILVQYQSLKKEVDAMRDKQKALRDERDRLYQHVFSLKPKEDDLKQKLQGERGKEDELKKNIDELYDRKRTLTRDYQSTVHDFHLAKSKQRQLQKEESQRLRLEKTKAAQEALRKQKAETEPYQSEKLLIAALKTYLQRYLVVTESDPAPAPASQQTATPSEAELQLEAEGMHVLRKKEEDSYAAISRGRNSKKNRRDRRKQQKAIPQTPEVISQFATLGLTAPRSMSDVPVAMNELQQKLDYYESMPVLLSASFSNSDGTESVYAPSVGESAISCSVPSTPEASTDPVPPRFPEGYSPVSIADSGTWEYDDSNLSDEAEGDELRSTWPKVDWKKNGLVYPYDTNSSVNLRLISKHSDSSTDTDDTIATTASVKDVNDGSADPTESPITSQWRSVISPTQASNMASRHSSSWNNDLGSLAGSTSTLTSETDGKVESLADDVRSIPDEGLVPSREIPS